MFAPRSFNVATGGDAKADIEARCAAVVDSTAKLGIVNPFSYYEEFVTGIERANISVVPLSEIAQPNASGAKRIALRHDIDADIVVAIACAQHLERRGLPGSFFPLHTAHYYGRFDRNGDALTFVRHEGLGELLADLRRTGMEIGIHNDALGVIHDQGADGIGHLVGEIEWMRGSGINVRSTVAHNSAAVYGAENFEIFKGLAVGDRCVVHWRGCSIPLQTLDMAGLGLEYEGNHPRLRPALDLKRLQRITEGKGDLLRQPDWLKAYFLDHPVFERGYDYDAWLIGRDQWVVAGAGDVHFPLTQSEFLNTLAALPNKTDIVVSVHPIYVAGGVPEARERSVREGGA